MNVSIRILIVDDEADLREAVCANLNQRGFKVSSAASGKEALSLVTRDHFDVIFSDISMANGDGLWLLRAVKELKPDIPFIFVTGNVDVSEKDMKKIGAFALLHKPVFTQRYQDLIQQALDFGKKRTDAESFMKTLPSCHISTTIKRSMSEVYDFVSDPRNLPRWASGLSSGVLTQEGDAWMVESPMGKVKIKFAPKNIFGVLDHDVTLASGETVHNPLRVFKNGEGSEVVFTLYRQPGVSDAKFKEDIRWVQKDLEALKSLMEGKTLTLLTTH